MIYIKNTKTSQSITIPFSATPLGYEFKFTVDDKPIDISNVKTKATSVTFDIKADISSGSHVYALTTGNLVVDCGILKVLHERKVIQYGK